MQFIYYRIYLLYIIQDILDFNSQTVPGCFMNKNKKQSI